MGVCCMRKKCMLEFIENTAAAISISGSKGVLFSPSFNLREFFLSGKSRPINAVK